MHFRGNNPAHRLQGYTSVAHAFSRSLDDTGKGKTTSKSRAAWRLVRIS